MRPGLRFKVLSRDNYTCRYCGAKAPDVKLHVDHVIPKARGGRDELSNLVTACETCNLGKQAKVTEQAEPSLTWDEFGPAFAEIQEVAREWFLRDCTGLDEEWVEITGSVPSPKTQMMLARMLLSCSFHEIRRAMYVSARQSGFTPGFLCECTLDEDCGIHVPLDPFELKMMLQRWHDDWFS